MAGNALAKLYSWADGVKRRVSNPLETIALGITRAGEDLGAAATDADIAYGRNGMKSVLLSEQQKAEAAKRAAQFGEQMAMAAATVWHGSPHKFDKFDSSKIGTGEGAQAYGHGLYLAESDKVANEYATMFNKSAPKPASLMRLRDSAPAGSSEWKHYDALLNEGQSNLYKVDLPDDAIAKMLDWDKPLIQQAPEVRDLVRKAIKPGYVNGRYVDPYSSGKTGSALMDELRLLADKNPGGLRTPEAAMQAAGLTGIRYLDGGSRGTGQGTSNYVVFPGNEKLLRILERNGQALP